MVGSLIRKEQLVSSEIKNLRFSLNLISIVYIHGITFQKFQCFPWDIFSGGLNFFGFCPLIDPQCFVWCLVHRTHIQWMNE